MPPDQVRLPVNCDLYCAACPREELVTNLLKEAGYTLVKQLAVPAQYHYEGAYGVTIIYVAGYDSSCDAQGKHSPKHAARFYVRGNTDPRSQERLQQVVAILTRLPVPFLRIKSHQQVSAWERESPQRNLDFVSNSIFIKNADITCGAYTNRPESE